MKYICNLDYDLVETVRASTAAPHYFGPERLVVARDVINNESQTVDGWFVDGGVSVMNNPALQAFMVATLDGFRLKWPTGKDKILLVSIGTGRKDPKRMPSRLAFRHAFESLLSLMDDCEAHVETMLQWMSTSPTARVIDGEIGDLSRDLISQNELMTYLRYDVELSTKWLGENLPGHYTEEYVKRMGDMDRPRNVPELEKLGEIAAKTLIPGRERFAEHFPPQFDPRR